MKKYLYYLTMIMSMNGKELLKNTEFLTHETDIFLPVSQELQNKNFCHLKSLTYQKDSWSCAYHSIFNAVAIHEASKTPHNFHESLKSCLTNRKLFEKVYNTALEYAKEAKALNGHEISQISSQLPIKDKQISLFLTDKDEPMIPCLFAETTYRIGMSKEEIEKLLDEKKKKLVQEKINDSITSLKYPFDDMHYICNTGNHWVTFSIILDAQKKANLYLIGAWNEPINDAMMKYIDLFLQKIRKNHNQ